MVAREASRKQAEGGRKGRVRTALTRVVPAQDRAPNQQKQKEAEEMAASYGSGPTDCGHGAL